MKTKTTKIITSCALALLVLSSIFILILLFLGVYSNAIRQSNGDLSEGIALGCSATILIIVIIFTLIVKFISIIFGFSSLFVKRKIAAILTLGVFTCILAIISCICSVYCWLVFNGIKNASSSATVMTASLIIAVVSDLIWFASIIVNTVATSKYAKTLSSASQEIEE